MKHIKYFFVSTFIFILGVLSPFEIQGFKYINICNQTDSDISYINVNNKVSFNNIQAWECSEHWFIGNIEIPFEVNVLVKQWDELYQYNAVPMDLIWSEKSFFGKDTIYIKELKQTKSKIHRYLHSVKYSYWKE